MIKKFLMVVSLITLSSFAYADDSSTPPKPTIQPIPLTCPDGRMLSVKDFEDKFVKPEETFALFTFTEIDKISSNPINIIYYFNPKTEFYTALRVEWVDSDLQRAKSVCIVSESYFSRAEAMFVAGEKHRLVAWIMKHSNESNPQNVEPKADGKPVAPPPTTEEPKDNSED